MSGGSAVAYALFVQDVLASLLCVVLCHDNYFHVHLLHLPSLTRRKFSVAFFPIVYHYPPRPVATMGEEYAIVFASDFIFFFCAHFSYYDSYPTFIRTGHSVYDRGER